MFDDVAELSFGMRSVVQIVVQACDCTKFLKNKVIGDFMVRG